jgi:hypothetical protein
MASSSSKKVSFGNLTITEYPMELGDNPSCGSGAPVTIGWEPQGSQIRNMELYEYTRFPRRSGKQLYLSVQNRARLLLKGGYTLQEIGRATHGVELARKLRADSISSHGNWNLVKMMLDTTGKLNKGIAGGVAGVTGETMKMVSKFTKPAHSLARAYGWEANRQQTRTEPEEPKPAVRKTMQARSA